MLSISDFGFSLGQKAVDLVSGFFKQGTDTVIKSTPVTVATQLVAAKTAPESAIKADTSRLGDVFGLNLGTLGQEIAKTGSVLIERAGQAIRDKIVGTPENTPLPGTLQIQLPQIVQNARAQQEAENDFTLERFFELVTNQVKPADTRSATQVIRDTVEDNTFQKYLPLFAVAIAAVGVLVIAQRR